MGLAFIVGTVFGCFFGICLTHHHLTIKYYKKAIEKNRRFQSYLNDQYTLAFNKGYDRAIHDANKPIGEWIVESEHSIRCSECCFNRAAIKMPLDFCPNCGAEMKGDEK